MRLFVTSLVSAALVLGGCGGGSGTGNAGTLQTNSVTNAPADTLPISWSLERKTADALGVRSDDVNALLTHIFTDAATQAAVVSKKGYVIGERYASGYDSASLGTSWSVAKSFYSALIGIAIEEQWIQSTQQSASDFITEWADSDKAEITIGQILAMRSGYSANDQVFFQENQTAYAIALPLASAPNSRFAYSNANSQLMEPLIRRATGLSAHAYLRNKLLQPLGIETAGLWLDNTGQQPMTYCCIDISADDFLKFGLLYARNGEWDGTQIVPADYVNDSLSPQSPYYGYQWWLLNEAYFGDSVPISVYAASGLHGQKIYVWPEADVVVVILTRYQHFANQGYVLDLSAGVENFPDTCSARNVCPDSNGNRVPTFDERQLLTLLRQLDATPAT
ncbi:MAG: class C beta-lactamase-related serine hydrolase [Gammaproteobacteria bacterium TMED92]|nr:MAG: class C beta-lactamase-related serine hydrolase [Gammaproteobacteria bacterium TMED92]